MKELFRTLIETIPVIASLLMSNVVIVLKLSKSVRLRKLAENLLKIEKIIMEYVCQAELLVNFSGEEKKEWVKTKVNQYCIINKMAYEDKTVDQFLEQNIQLSKTVNIQQKNRRTPI